ncbi:CarboxypepD_reg-like domain-containing protein [Mucilaginibacter sp. OK268]|uniref:carboxypeptidase-like regulatory domain-containing protein n=1 Tax=Mucilaginibacter sp. OK268 TaxID=1881048 RepID=UPI00088EBFDF|nr:carboxypeptidase-like regulatory domain-containing protein [Mucilaginibacter sp. OK268]SDP04881.1 CarboxypepD_reg-like domain-containing protein [Mucilaginibacter sp. OK268]
MIYFRVDMYKIVLLLFLIPVSLSAQVTITGRVVNTADKNPVADASVFLNNSVIGNKTLNDGSFRLFNVKNGKYDLVVSCVGYKTYHQDVTVSNNNIVMSEIALVTNVNELSEVKIKVTKPEPAHRRNRFLRIFTSEFFGHTKNASECTILNPEQLDFDYDEKSDKLKATSSDFLIIENKALGYRIKYLLVSFLADPRNGIVAFTGSSLFEVMTGTSEQEITWQKKRVAAYKGSEMHFLRACMAYQVPEEGFTVRKVVRTPTVGRPPDSLINVKLKTFAITSGVASMANDSIKYWSKMAKQPRYDQTVADRVLKIDEYITLTKQKGIYGFGYTDWLMINYQHRSNGSNEHTTFITFNEPYAYFDSNGVVFTPESCLIEGYWGVKRIAELLPVDYELPADL